MKDCHCCGKINRQKAIICYYCQERFKRNKKMEEGFYNVEEHLKRPRKGILTESFKEVIDKTMES